MIVDVCCESIPERSTSNVNSYGRIRNCNGSLFKVRPPPSSRFNREGTYQNKELIYRVKGCRSSNSALAGASGLQYLVSNHEQVLADAVYRQFEIPLLEALDHYKLETADRLVMYEKALTEQSARIRKTESENLKNARRRKRGESPFRKVDIGLMVDLTSFRQALADLQRQVDELDGIKAGYHEEVLEGEDEVSS